MKNHGKKEGTKKQKGGFLLDFIFGKKLKRRTRRKSSESTTDRRRTRRRQSVKKDAIANAIASETNLIDSYEALSDAAREYYQDYNTHLQNLITLDDINGMTGLQTTFKNVLTRSLFKGTQKVDTSNPLLLRNYTVTEDTTPKFFRKEHLMRQVRACLFTEFILKDSILISSWDIDFKDNMATIKVTTMNNEKHEFKVPVDEHYMLNADKLKLELTDVIISVKRKIDYEVTVEDFAYKNPVVELPPGLDYATEETIADKLKMLRKSVAIDEAILDRKSSESAKKPEGPVYLKKGLIMLPERTPSDVPRRSSTTRVENLPVGQNTLQMGKAQDAVTTQLLESIVQQGPTAVMGPVPVVPAAPVPVTAASGDPTMTCPQYDANETECWARGCFYNKYTHKCAPMRTKAFATKPPN